MVTEAEMAEHFATPTEISDVLLAFPTKVDDLMPSYAWLQEHPPSQEWVDFQRIWFGYGLHPETSFNLREGIDGQTMWRHLQACQSTYSIKHEHKMLAVGWLASQWCEGIRYARSGAESCDRLIGTWPEETENDEQAAEQPQN